MTVVKKKLIEVALPLEAINKASAREKSIRHGHPSTLHLWWARRPLAAARAVIFAQMVDDPSALPDLFPTEADQQKERERLFRIIEDLVLWENTTNETVLQAAREEIWHSWRRACADNVDHPRAKELFDRKVLPAFHDPFAGGGALPLEAQRLGLASYASDLNPVAVLINKAMIEIPPKFAGKPPVNPEARKEKSLLAREWKGAQGLADDVRHYGQWMRDEAQKRIGHLYPKIAVTAEMARERPDLKPYVDQELTVIAWLWARTVKSPNPAFAHVDVPLVSTFLLSTKAGKEAYVEVVVVGDREEERGERVSESDSRPSLLSPHSSRGYRFTVKVGKPEDMERAKAGTKASRANFNCVMSNTPISGDYIKVEGNLGRMGSRLMAIVAEGTRGRVYLAPTIDHEAAPVQAKPEWKPDGEIAKRMTGGNCTPYGLTTWGALFTPRQLVALTTFSDLVGEAMEQVRRDAVAAGLHDDPTPLRDGGRGATAYAEAVGVYLGFGASRAADAWSSIVTWRNQVDATRNTFARQAVPMTWDYSEVNPFSRSCGNWIGNSVEWVEQSLLHLPSPADILQAPRGVAEQADAATQTFSDGRVVSTDPPYYDNIGYADLSDFFYVWLRKTLRAAFPAIFGTLAVPKAEELVATPYRHGSKQNAERFFLEGMTDAMRRLAGHSHLNFPVTIYYAFKQSEGDGAVGTSSTGWETFLEAVIHAGFGISGTWPMRTEKQGRVIANDTNALASSIVLVCRKRPEDAPTATRREFVTALKAELPSAIRTLQGLTPTVHTPASHSSLLSPHSSIAPVDLAQAAIGPGMAVYTRYAKVLDSEGKTVPVREALVLINQILDETLAEQEGDFDADTRFALAWFDQHGFAEGEFGIADVLARAKNTSVDGLGNAGILESRRGKVRLLRPTELPEGWDPTTDTRLTHWETVHQLVRVLNTGGESAAADLLAKLGTRGEAARELCYRLYTLCERRKRSAEALSYNALVQSFPEIIRLATTGANPGRNVGGLFDSEEDR
jgi:putative DNA methylase